MKNVCLLIAALLVSFPAFGAALGQTPRASMVGYAIGAAYASVDDPQGETESAWALQPVTLIYTARLFSGVRYWSEFYYYTAGLGASTDQIGQNVERFGLQISLQKSLPLSASWVTWFGAGLGALRSNYTTRHTVDDEGFLLETYPDRSDTGAALLLNFVSEWSLNKDWSLGVKLEQAIALAGDVDRSRGSLALLYKY